MTKLSTVEHGRSVISDHSPSQQNTLQSVDHEQLCCCAVTKSKVTTVAVRFEPQVRSAPSLCDTISDNRGLHTFLTIWGRFEACKLD